MSAKNLSEENLRTLVLHIEDINDQVYSMEDETGWQYHWNASRAERLGREHNRCCVFSLVAAGITPEFLLAQYPDLDEVYAINTDITRPLVFVPLGGKDQLVDGWHRLYHGSLLGVDDMLAYFLTQEEADECLIVKLPPGQGLDWGQPKNAETQESKTRSE